MCSRFAHGLQRSTPAPGTPRYQHADLTHNAAVGKMLLSILDFKTGEMLVTRSIRGNTVTFLWYFCSKKLEWPATSCLI